MTSTTLYPELDQLFGAYLNQDYKLWGDTLEEVVRCYKRDSNAEDNQHLLEELARFSSTHAEDLDASFLARYGFDFDPRLWSHTTASFFELVRHVLSEG